MDYYQLRKDIIFYLNALQRKGHTYQDICDYINDQQSDFVLFKDFFSRFQSKPNHYKRSSKREKLQLIYQHIQALHQKYLGDSYSIEDLLKTIVLNASAAVFETYLSLNRKETSQNELLIEYFQESSPALLNIENTLKHKKQYKWILDIHNYGSFIKILSFEDINLFTQNAIVKTKEFRKLFWVDGQSQKLQFKYESLGSVTYLLSKNVEGHWKIIEIMLNPSFNQLEPAYIDFDHLKLLRSTSREENKKIVNQFLLEGDILNGIEYVKIIFSDKLLKNQISILKRISDNYLNSLRLLNTGAVNITMFNAEAKLLIKQTQLICDSIFLTFK